MEEKNKQILKNQAQIMKTLQFLAGMAEESKPASLDDVMEEYNALAECITETEAKL